MMNRGKPLGRHNSSTQIPRKRSNIKATRSVPHLPSNGIANCIWFMKGNENTREKRYKLDVENKNYTVVFAAVVSLIHTVMTVPSGCHHGHQNYTPGRICLGDINRRLGERGEGPWCKLASSKERLCYNLKKQNGRLAKTSSAHLCGPGNSVLDRSRSLDPDVEKLWCAYFRFHECDSLFSPSEFLNSDTMKFVWRNPTHRPCTQFKRHQVVETLRVVTPIWSKTSAQMRWGHFHELLILLGKHLFARIHIWMRFKGKKNADDLLSPGQHNTCNSEKTTHFMENRNQKILSQNVAL